MQCHVSSSCVVLGQTRNGAAILQRISSHIYKIASISGSQLFLLSRRNQVFAILEMYRMCPSNIQRKSLCIKLCIIGLFAVERKEFGGQYYNNLWIHRTQ